MGVWGRHTGVLLPAPSTVSCVGGCPLPLLETQFPPPHGLHGVQARNPHHGSLLTLPRCHRGRELGKVEEAQPGRPGSGLESRIPLHPKSLYALGGIVLPSLSSCPHSQVVVEELEIQRGRATCPKSHSEAGHRPPCLASERSCTPSLML